MSYNYTTSTFSLVYEADLRLRRLAWYFGTTPTQIVEEALKKEEAELFETMTAAEQAKYCDAVAT